MPSIATHYLFGQTFYKSSNHFIKNTIRQSKGAFLLGLQGPDIFLYDILQSMVTKDKNIGKIMHTERTDIYFYKFISYVREHNLYHNPTVLAYFYGILCHYCLDCATHPYVYYFTSSNDTTPVGKQASLEAHFRFEANIDQLLFHDFTGIPISNIHRSNFMKISSKEIKTLSPVIAFAVSETYKSDFSYSFIEGSIKRGLLINSILNDKYGIKRCCIGKIENIFSKKHMITSMIYSKKLPSRSCLNEDKKDWYIPVDNTKMQVSFIDLYHQGLTQAHMLINMASEMMNGKCKISKFINATGAMSYHTGQIWRGHNQMHYFNTNSPY